MANTKAIIWFSGIAAAAVAAVLFLPKLLKAKPTTTGTPPNAAANNAAADMVGGVPLQDTQSAALVSMYGSNVYATNNNVGMYNYDSTTSDGAGTVYKVLSQGQLAGQITAENPQSSLYWLIDDQYVVRKALVSTNSTSSFSGGMRGTRFDLENSLRYMI